MIKFGKANTGRLPKRPCDKCGNLVEHRHRSWQIDGYWCRPCIHKAKLCDAMFMKRGCPRYCKEA